MAWISRATMCSSSTTKMVASTIPLTPFRIFDLAEPDLELRASGAADFHLPPKLVGQGLYQLQTERLAILHVQAVRQSHPVIAYDQTVVVVPLRFQPHPHFALSLPRESVFQRVGNQLAHQQTAGDSGIDSEKHAGAVGLHLHLFRAAAEN